MIEAKAHVQELYSDGSGAKAPRSVELINTALTNSQAALAAKSDIAWTGCFYQYANRLAHLWWLRERSVDAYLVFVYFLNDTTVTRAPGTQAEWEAALYVMKRCLGVTDHRLRKWALDIFVDVKDLPM